MQHARQATNFQVRKGSWSAVQRTGGISLRDPRGAGMDEPNNRVGRREKQIIDLLLQGCDNSEIAQDLNIAERTVKAHFNRLFLRFGIKGGIKRVKLATMLYRRQLWSEKQSIPADPIPENMPSSNSSPKAVRTGKLQIPSAQPNTLSRTTSA
jgi:hypothetical protein